MEEGKNYYLVTEHAIPEVLIKVVNAKKLIESGRAASVQEATESVGISRSSFYKYKDDILPFHDTTKGTTITLSVQMDDEPGLLSDVLKSIAAFKANILTIHQSIPINGIASLTISIQVLSETEDVSKMVDAMNAQNGVQSVKILGKSLA
ncbi:MAG: ACT domain-containing protein [Lachnospiraceae bacterium]|nr:ACT domain-containing protein [Lachnospiraceae bacterium]MDN4743777.1 ACT domain-containing protein [Lachnospiraceae bacterium C1.1]